MATKNPDVIDTTSIPGYTIQKWTTVGTGDWTIPAGVASVEYLVVAGGGAGGADRYGGGGGAGGLKTATGLTVTPGASVTVTVGAGGTGQSGSYGTDGGSSVFDSISTTGGGGGVKTGTGRNGGSGGGAASGDDTSYNGGAKTGSEGSAGGNSNYYGGGGGGGYSAAGVNRTSLVDGDGGAGYNASGFGISQTCLFDLFTKDNTGYSNVYDVNWRGMTFTPGESFTIKSVKLSLQKVGSPGTINVSIKATSGGLPTGSALCSGTLAGSSVGTSQGWNEITLGSGASLTGGTQYVILVDVRTGDVTNHIRWYSNTAGGYGGGNYILSSNSGSTYSDGSPIDLLFEVWGTTTYLAGGGGGAVGTGALGPSLGAAGGGFGGQYTISQIGTAAVANSGSGGGGYGGAGTGAGLAGGSGFVAIKYRTPAPFSLFVTEG